MPNHIGYIHEIHVLGIHVFYTRIMSQIHSIPLKNQDFTMSGLKILAKTNFEPKVYVMFSSNRFLDSLEQNNGH